MKTKTQNTKHKTQNTQRKEKVRNEERERKDKEKAEMVMQSDGIPCLKNERIKNLNKKIMKPFNAFKNMASGLYNRIQWRGKQLKEQCIVN